MRPFVLGMHARFAALAALVAVVFGCDEAGRKEAAALDRAVMAYREAENPHKSDHAKRLESVPCQNKDVCAAKAACLVTAKATGEGLEKKRVVEEFMANEFPKLSPGDPKAQEMLTTLDAAEKLLVTGRDSVAPCDEAMRNLRKTYSLR
jgi:hypothetical protein